VFANRFTALVDACSLAGALKRNLILTLAEAEFFRLRWSAQILGETEAAIADILAKKQAPDHFGIAKKQRETMEAAFADAMVPNYERFLCVTEGLPDPNDAHVLAAAIATRAHVLVTDNLKDFPSHIADACGIQVLSTDEFLANTIALAPEKAVLALRIMRERFKRPEKTADLLLIDMEAQGLLNTVDVLRPHVGSL
jgi:predicted nucleic acid-binding protein